MPLEPDSPEGQASKLAGAPPLAAVKAGNGLSDMLSLDEAVVALIQSCLRHFLANWPVFYRGDAVEAVHQMRVAMRRLRSVLGLFNRAFPTPEFAGFRAEAKRIAGVMGEARNWDVFLELLQEGPAAAFTAEPGMAAILEQCQKFRAAGYEAVHALLADPATSRFVLNLEVFLARHGWRNGVPAEALESLTAPAVEFAAANLLRLHRKVRKRGKHILSLGPHERHLVRIELKKLRYAADLFGGLFDARGKVKNYIAAAAALQEELGHLNDLVTARELLNRLEESKPAEARAIGIVLGWCAHAALANDKLLEKCWKAFLHSKPPADEEGG
jgi:CHAD domain-containing protein